MCNGKLRIFEYTSKDGKPYSVAYYDGLFRLVFVHNFDNGKIQRRISKKGVEYIYFDGNFKVENKNIYIGY